MLQAIVQAARTAVQRMRQAHGGAVEEPLAQARRLRTVRSDDRAPGQFSRMAGRRPDKAHDAGRSRARGRHSGAHAERNVAATRLRDQVPAGGSNPAGHRTGGNHRHQLRQRRVSHDQQDHHGRRVRGHVQCGRTAATGAAVHRFVVSGPKLADGQRYGDQFELSAMGPAEDKPATANGRVLPVGRAGKRPHRVHRQLPAARLVPRPVAERTAADRWVYVQ